MTSPSEKLYRTLTDADPTADAPTSGSDDALEVPRSFVLLLGSYFLTKLGDAIASPKTTLAWVISAVGAPPLILGLLVPIRESGSMLPQLFVGGAVKRLPIRKWVWVVGSCGQCVCICGIGLTAWLLEGAWAGWTILALVALFSLARSLSSVAAKDVLAKTIPKPRRGQLNGLSASAAGLVSIGVGITLMLPGVALDENTLGGLIVGAGLLWLVAALIYAQVPEPVGESSSGGGAAQALKSLRILITDSPFRRFVLTRALLMCSALSAPFYVALAQADQRAGIGVLGLFVAAAGLAGLVSGPIWGRFADASSRRVMIIGGLATAVVGIATFLVVKLAPSLAQSPWFLPLAYFALSVAHAGVRVGRKTYVVNLGTGGKRTEYVSVGNSTIGVLLLLAGSVGVLAPWISNAGVIALLAMMGLAGAVAGATLRDVERV